MHRIYIKLIVIITLSNVYKMQWNLQLPALIISGFVLICTGVTNTKYVLMNMRICTNGCMKVRSYDLSYGSYNLISNLKKNYDTNVCWYCKFNVQIVMGNMILKFYLLFILFFNFISLLSK